MLPHYVYNAVNNAVSDAVEALKNYQFRTHLHYLEARISLNELKKIISSPINPNIQKNIKTCLSARAKRILHTDIHYLHDFNNPVNIAYTQIAKIISDYEIKPYLTLLMPRLTRVSTESYITSSYKTENLELRECILDETGERLINILDVINFAIDDGILKHNTLKNNKLLYLSETEIEWILSRDPTINTAFTALHNLVEFKRYGVTVGAAIKRLIDGLKKGSTRYRGEEYEAGTEALNAIADFFEYFYSLPISTQNTLMKIRCIGDYDLYFTNRLWYEMGTCLTFLKGKVAPRETTPILPTPFPIADETQALLDAPLPSDAIAIPIPTTSQFWFPVTTMGSQRDLLDPQYCVDIISDHLQKILNDNLYLYDVMPDNQELTTNLTLLQSEYDVAYKNMIAAIPTINTHFCFGEEQDFFILIDIIEELITKLDFFSLELGDVVLLIKAYLEYSADPELANTCKQIRITINYVSKHYDISFKSDLITLLSPEEYECFQTLGDEMDFVTVGLQELSLFSPRQQTSPQSMQETYGFEFEL